VVRAVAILLLAGSALAHPLADEDRDAARERRGALRRELGDDYALVFAQPFTDILQPRQEGHYLYLTGVREPGGVLLLGPRSELLFLPELEPKAAQFLGHEFHPDEATAKRLGLATRALPRGADGLRDALAAILPEGARLRVPGYRGADQATVRERRETLLAGLAQRRADIVVADLTPALLAMRVIKDKTELAHLRRAIAITEQAFRAAIPHIRAGSLESDVESALMAAVRAAGARPSFPFVVGGGRNAAIPHYFANDAPLPADGLVVVDAGAAYRRYAADITRTFPIAGTFSNEQGRVYDAVLEAQRAGIAAVRPGASFRDIHKAAYAVLEKHGLAEHFIHATSHHVGLDAHDPGPTRPLRPGMTLTVEPGVYILDRRIGVRIEDIVLVTGAGCEVLSTGLPKQRDEVERLLAALRPAAAGK